MLIFKNPMGLFLVLPLVFVVLLVHARYKNRVALPLEVFGGRPFTRAPALPIVAYYCACLLLVSGWVLVGLAWTEPVYVIHDARIADSDGIVMYIVDCSPSMAAGDVEPSRLARAVRLVENAQTETSMMGGLVAFGKDAALVCPPTTNTHVLLERLRRLKPGQFGEGTDILNAVKSALLQVSALSVRKAIFVIITDGEDEESLRGLSVLLKKDARFDIVLTAVGREGDAPITYIDPATQTEFSGIYKSAFNPEQLKQYAEDSGFTFLLNPERIDIPESAAMQQKHRSEFIAEEPVPLLELGVALLVAGWFILFIMLGGKP